MGAEHINSDPHASAAGPQAQSCFIDLHPDAVMTFYKTVNWGHPPFYSVLFLKTQSLSASVGQKAAYLPSLAISVLGALWKKLPVTAVVGTCVLPASHPTLAYQCAAASLISRPLIMFQTLSECSVTLRSPHLCAQWHDGTEIVHVEILEENMMAHELVD